MYKIIGSDGQEYGPVDGETLRRWVVEGRANQQTLVQAEGQSDWKPLSAHPELAGGIAAALPRPPTAPVPPPFRSAAAGPSLPPPTSGMAVAALVLGVCGFLTCGLAALPGLICGIVALTRINRSGGRIGGQGLAIAGVCVSGVALVILPIYAGMLLPALAQARDRARAVMCMSHMKELGLGFAIYADQNSERLPDAERWADALRDGGMVTEKVFQCPAAPGHRCAYAFNRNMSGGEWQADADAVVLIESARGWNGTVGGPQDVGPPNHRDGYNVLYNDGRVERVAAEALDRLRWQPRPSR
jgi:hypothetical protein